MHAGVNTLEVVNGCLKSALTVEDHVAHESSNTFSIALQFGNGSIHEARVSLARVVSWSEWATIRVGRFDRCDVGRSLRQCAEASRHLVDQDGVAVVGIFHHDRTPLATNRTRNAHCQFVGLTTTTN
ncbi:hypothetical protein D9M68_797200 [compost metagenome]